MDAFTSLFKSGAQVPIDQILDHFLEFLSTKGVSLYPAQEEAILELFDGKNVILNTPTGSGKSLVALALHFDSIVRGRRSYYTSPIKALVNEKFFALCKDLGAENVGLITGDATVNPEAPVICCTAEILMIHALRGGSQAPVQDVVMDEFHYYSDRERGVAWQVPLLTLPQTRFLLMSATLGETEFFERELTRLNGRPTLTVRSSDRPVPLSFQYSEDPLLDSVQKLLRGNQAPIYLVSFTQRECAERAQDFLSIDFCTKEEKRLIADELTGFSFSSPYGKELQKFIRHGIGIHHAGLLPKYRLLIERLAQKGLLKIIFGTDTLGVGVNVPIRTVLFTQLCKYDGEKSALVTVRDFHQIAGRAGRKGFDTQGTVVVQAPEHIIENLRNEQKAAGDAKKIKKLVKRKPPEKGYVAWDRSTLERLIQSPPEPLQSRFQVSHAMLLSVLSRPEETGCRDFRSLIRDCHESENRKKNLRKTAFSYFRSLVERQIITLNPLRVGVELQEDFSLNHTLSLYLLDTLKLIDDPVPETAALQLLTLAESILENPDQILRRQLDKAKTIKMQELKAQGMEFDERIEELEKLEYPKPHREWIYDTYNRFAAEHPWVGAASSIRPKSIAREMIEQFLSFSDYIKEYGLERSEGLLLRYITDVYKVLIQTVPQEVRTDALLEIIVYLRAQIRSVDSSLIDEWEQMRNPGVAKASQEAAATELERKALAAKQRKELTIELRNRTFAIVKRLAQKEFDLACAHIDGIDSAALERSLTDYLAIDHARLCTDGKARSPQHCRITEDTEGRPTRIEQVLVDPDGHNDWSLKLEVDWSRVDDSGQPTLVWAGMGTV